MRDTLRRKHCEIAVDVQETLDRTDATATVVVEGQEVQASGHARRNPSDVAVPLIGEELAVARALANLSDELGRRAAQAIERSERHPPLRWVTPPRR